MKKIVLVASASYFEGHRKIVQSVVSTTRALGDYSVDIITNYGRFGHEDSAAAFADASSYELLNLVDYDGAIVENNIGNVAMINEIVEHFHSHNVPVVAINSSSVDCPFFCQNYHDSAKQLIEHMILEHGAKKINLIVNEKDSYLGEQAFSAYEEVLSQYSIPIEEKRIVEQRIGIEYGETLYDRFIADKTDDCDAVILFHDVNAIGLINKYTENGVCVPEDVKVASLHYSNNSMIYRPDITGVVVDDEENARRAVLALDELINNKTVPISNYSSGKIKYGRSCGCEKCRDEYFDDNGYQNVVMSKISNASQIRAMMSYNQSLGNISSMEELGERISIMMEQLGCNNFCVCINHKDIVYLTNENAIHHTTPGHSFDDDMYVLSSTKDGSDGVVGTTFPTKDIYPIPAKIGDVHYIMPIRLDAEVYGYVVVKNNLLPSQVYNYRICYESLGQSFEMLHQQLILLSVIEAKDRLRLKDFMTGTYNKAGLEYFKPQYFNDEKCAVVIVDVDGLKKVNDEHGHLHGDTIIQITANALIDTVDESDVVIRYGGDEFMILSHNTDTAFWDSFNDTVNSIIETNIQKRQLPYTFRASSGYSIYDSAKNTPDEIIADADSKMYSDKVLHKGTR